MCPIGVAASSKTLSKTLFTLDAELMPMGEFVATFILPALFLATYLLQLILGFAVAGMTSDNILVDRRTKPGHYWFIMALQTLVLFGIPLVLSLSGE